MVLVIFTILLSHGTRTGVIEQHVDSSSPSTFLVTGTVGIGLYHDQAAAATTTWQHES
jgi:hypothetical protein